MAAPVAAAAGLGPRGGRRALSAGLLAGALFLAVWLPLQPDRALPPTADLYTHLTVARHLARGDGYLTDVAYPLSFAYPFARRLPQPLIHRMPGQSTLLVLPYLTSGGDPARTPGHVRALGALLLAGGAGLGCWGLWRAGRAAGTGLWLVLLGSSPLLGFAVAWGQDEIPTGLLLLTAWLLLRISPNPHPFAAGALAGVVALFRLELAWVVPLWWLLLRGRGPRSWLMLATMLVVLTPWSLRNLALTGQPFFTLQGVAELAKDTRTHPGYEVYRSLEPMPLLETLAAEPEPVARKFARGLRFYRTDLTGLLPWPWLVVLAASPLGAVGRRFRLIEPDDLPAAGVPPLPLAVGSLVLLMLLYAPFDHSLRHLIPILPVVCWELSRSMAGALSLRGRAPAAAVWAGSAPLGILLALAAPSRLPGWESAARDAASAGPTVAAEAAAVRSAPPGPVFVESGAAPWRADRPGIWAPLAEQDRQTILLLLSQDPAPAP